MFSMDPRTPRASGANNGYAGGVSRPKTVCASRARGWLLGLLCLGVLAGCGGGGAVDVQTAESVPLRLDKKDPERLVRSVLGGYTAEAGADPFEAGLVSGEGDGLTLHPQKLAPAIRQQLSDADGDGAIGPDEWTDWVEATYYSARGLPATVAALREAVPYASGDAAWFEVEVDGVMTAARRRLFLPVTAVRAALEAHARGDGLMYPAGTWIIGEHLIDGEVVETTVKHRREDGYWDFAVYDGSGALAPATSTEPRALRTPTQCTGCHLGQKLFEPEKSWPGAASDGPFGPRAYHVPDAWRSPEAAALFNEHARRDDGVLGLYGTLYASQLLTDRASGAISPEDAAFLDRLGL
ncbi:hypothetical protein [Rubricoccus marinus]|uniref:EF-hand domain-containing protein n=1 Tax=Rubricoccus marinus TaxID=716817 RepID=A0A259TW88_9BACT|nr:hypothetical protein [Rubricoccus marinus]OZC02003.1 hypothetical protein BSZ36_02820 [Rubricoccus marinus]